MERVGLAVIGGGQAGLAVSHELSALGIDHVVFERGRIGQTWRGRWKTFCLVTPNWTVQLPGLPYDGDDPDGYLPRDEIVDYLERYARSFRAPIREGVDVRSLARDGDRFLLETSEGPIGANQVIVATGAYQRPFRPSGASTLPDSLFVIDVEQYDQPADLPPGGVLIVGSGQSGCQIAEELHEAGREVVLACGRAPWGPRRLGSVDIVWWVVNTGYWDAPLSSLANPEARLIANILSTGHGGGHDLHLRTLQRMGVGLAGHFLGAEDGHLRFADDLAQTVAWGDERYNQFMGLVRKTVHEKGLVMPEIAAVAPFRCEPVREAPIAEFGSVIFAGGFRPDYGRWIKLPQAFDNMGFPVQVDGVSATIPGLYFVGVHFLRKRQSSLLYGVGEDAAIVARSIAGRVAAGRP
jgi:putative flavoprotein involved in K+ transport